MARSLSCCSVVTTGTLPASGPWLTNGRKVDLALRDRQASRPKTNRSYRQQ